jgi:hypothetical protein
VNNGRDEIDSWLEREVTPLMPRPGTLDAIRRRARRRKTTQAVVVAGACAVVIGALTALPQLTSGLDHNSGHKQPAAAGGPAKHTSVQPSPAGSSQAPSVTQSSKLPTPSDRSYLSAKTTKFAVPADFRPTSVTFVGNGKGGVVGAVIGQAGDAAHPCSTMFCTSLAGTATNGATWYGVSAPLTPGPTGAVGVSQLRFLDLTDGWAFGPGLWETARGGWPWQKEDTFGQNVIDLEAGRDPATGHASAFAIFASCTGTGLNYGTGCTSFRLYTSAPGSTTWTPAAVPAAFQSMTTSAPSAASLAVGAGRAYLLTPSGEVLSGSVAGGSWKDAGPAPCKPTGAQASGQTLGAHLTSGPKLVLACDSNGSSAIYTSKAGASWQLAGSVRVSGTVTSIASSSPSTAVLATTRGIYYSATMGASWQAASIAGGAPGGGFTYIGMTTPTFGVAIPADAGLNELFVTNDAGKTWTPSPVTS